MVTTDDEYDSCQIEFDQWQVSNVIDLNIDMVIKVKLNEIIHNHVEVILNERKEFRKSGVNN